MAGKANIRRFFGMTFLGRTQPFSQIGRAFVVAAVFLFLVSCSIGSALAQTTPTPSFGIKVTPEGANAGAEITVDITGKDLFLSANQSGLRGMQGVIKWSPATGVIEPVYAAGSGNQAITCTPTSPLSTQNNNQCAVSSNQAGFLVLNNTGTAFTEGTIIRFKFKVVSNATSGSKVTFTLDKGSIQAQIGNTQLAQDKFTLDPASAVFTVGQSTPNCTFALGSFTANNLNPRAGDAVTINLTMTRNAECTSFPSLSVTFSDNNQVETITGTLTRSITHTFANQGSYTATLRYTSDNSVINTLNFTVAPPPCKPTNVDFTFTPAKPVVEKKVTFKAVGTACSISGTVTFNWVFTCFSGGNNRSGTPVEVTFTNTNPNGCTVTLTVRDSGGGEEKKVKQIPVADRPSCETLRCALRQSSTLRRKLINFARDNVFPFDAAWEKTNQALNAPNKSLLERLMELAETMSGDAKDQFEDIIGEASGTVEAIRDGVDAATEAGDISASRARNITDQIDRFMNYLDDTLPDIMDAISETLSELQNAYEEASDLLGDADAGAGEAVDALYNARSFLAKVRAAVNGVLTTILNNMSKLARAVSTAERLARRRSGGGGNLPSLMALGVVTLTRTSNQALVFQAEGATELQVQLYTMSGQLAFASKAQGPLLTLFNTQALANGVYLAHVTAKGADNNTNTRLFKLVLMR
jgi:hypothetical protein